MDKEPDTSPSRPGIPLWVFFLIPFIIFNVVSLFTLSEPAYQIPYSQLKQFAHDGRISSVELRGNTIKGKLLSSEVIGPNDLEGDRFIAVIPTMGDESLLPLLEENSVEITVLNNDESGSWRTLFMGMIPWLLFILIFYWWSQRAAKSMGERMGGFGQLDKFMDQSSTQSTIPEVDFTAVAGQENAKSEVADLVEYLKNPEDFKKLGADVPHGILLMGPPGTGKTLLARALAGEAGVPFYSISGSGFIEVFVGVGAARVRSLFKAAREKAPSIIFIDELDSIGRARGTGLGGGNDEREQTLNQILAEMDGFKAHDDVIVLAATNRPDVLDPALLRPGRFDRHVTLDLPDIKDRIAILKLHTNSVSIQDNIDLGIIAAGTPGFSGADLKNLVNEAAILAAREKDKLVLMRHFDAAREKVLMGSERKLTIQPDERHRLAVHEAGHTLMAFSMPHADPIYKVSIIPRGRALGATQQLPVHERYTLDEDYLRDRLVVLLGGRAAEHELLGNVSSGADDDIQQATKLARSMVTRWGMSDEIGPVDLRDSDEHPFLGREMALPHHYSEYSMEQVDLAVKKLLLDSQARAVKQITKHRGELEKLVAMLEEKETLSRVEIEQCLTDLPDNKVIGSIPKFAK
ncbi:MAG: cell division protease FtsH [Planctomycetota bacterium]|jgi:cell division protease FtsH